MTATGASGGAYRVKPTCHLPCCPWVERKQHCSENTGESRRLSPRVSVTFGSLGPSDSCKNWGSRQVCKLFTWEVLPSCSEAKGMYKDGDSQLMSPGNVSLASRCMGNLKSV